MRLRSTVKNNALRKEAHHDLFIETTNPDTGQIDITVNTDVKEVSIVQLPLKDFGRQVVTDVKDATKTTYSVQMNKNLISGLYEEGQIAVKSWHSFNILEDSAVAISSEEEAKAYVSNLINNLNESTEKQLEIRYFALLKKLGLKDVNGVISANEEDYKNLKKTLLEAATNNGVSANIINNINVLQGFDFQRKRLLGTQDASSLVSEPLGKSRRGYCGDFSLNFHGVMSCSKCLGFALQRLGC